MEENYASDYCAHCGYSYRIIGNNTFFCSTECKDNHESEMYQWITREDYDTEDDEDNFEVEEEMDYGKNQ